ncbi:MAG: A/G-specific adenine glycosylase [Elusimicrobia bacterium]|nr:A/G-specific adenine glycosylase [Elusimicrobiota bacterium]
MRPAPATFQKKLLAWYRVHGRHDLPWRRSWDPYPVLVSELMLQQTTVATVIPYFERFLQRFPTLAALASARLESVLELWSGLGYYARARNLHRAAQILVNRHGGRMPRDREAVDALPGVGPYTAGAVLSFAFNQPAALVDGNVIRVLARVYGVRQNTKTAPVSKRLWALAKALTPPGGARHYNSALMDLGATVCRPAAPDCARCPLSGVCWARRQDRVADIPATGGEPAKKTIYWHAAMVEKDGRWLLRRRPSTGLYAGLWEFPDWNSRVRRPGPRSPAFFGTASACARARSARPRLCGMCCPTGRYSCSRGCANPWRRLGAGVGWRPGMFRGLRFPV